MIDALDLGWYMRFCLRDKLQIGGVEDAVIAIQIRSFASGEGRLTCV